MPADLIRIVSERVRIARRRRGLSQLALAQAAGLPERTVWRVEAGESNTQLVTIAKLAAALGIRPADLFP